MFYDKGRAIFTYPGMAVVSEPVNLRRPPNEADSLILQATIGCPWNRCVFCGNYKRKKFCLRYPDIKEDIGIAGKIFGERAQKIFLADANSIVLKTKWLSEIAQECFTTFSNLERISVYGSARFIVRKEVEDLKILRQAGIRKIYLGLETGDDMLLEYMNKGATSKGMLKAARMIINADIELSVTVIQGLGGKKSWRRNAKLTAQLLNEMKPQETRLHNLIVHPDALLYEKVVSGEFHEASPDEVLKETKELIRQLNINTEIYTYSTNYLHPRLLDGKLPKDKEYMMKILDLALTSEDRKVFFQNARMI